MALFRRLKGSRGAATAQLDEFIASRRGVEAYVEPATQFAATTMLLVAHDGESMRRQIKSPQWAINYCKKQQIPCYDATIVGYPNRMREFKQRTKARQRGSAATPARASVTERTPAQRNALMTLEALAGAEPLGDAPTEHDLQALLKQARARAHPDRHGGNRDRWDRVEAAARTLDLL